MPKRKEHVTIWPLPTRNERNEGDDKKEWSRWTARWLSPSRRLGKRKRNELQAASSKTEIEKERHYMSPQLCKLADGMGALLHGSVILPVTFGISNGYPGGCRKYFNYCSRQISWAIFPVPLVNNLGPAPHRVQCCWTSRCSFDFVLFRFMNSIFQIWLRNHFDPMYNQL